MARQISSYGRFFAALKALNPVGDAEEVRRSIILQYTNGRTDSLREMTEAEYRRCCYELEQRCGQKDALRKERSATLRLMQKMGVDTTDWARINNLTRNHRIIGKDFARITVAEHRELRRKLRSIERKGGFEKPERLKMKTEREEKITPTGQPARQIYIIKTTNTYKA